MSARLRARLRTRLPLGTGLLVALVLTEGCATAARVVPPAPIEEVRELHIPIEHAGFGGELSGRVRVREHDVEITLISGYVTHSQGSRAISLDSLLVRVVLAQSGRPISRSETAFEVAIAPAFKGLFSGFASARPEAALPTRVLERPLTFSLPRPCDRPLSELWPVVQLAIPPSWGYAHADRNFFAGVPGCVGVADSSTDSR